MLTGMERFKLALVLFAIVGGAVGMGVLAIWPKHLKDSSPPAPTPPVVLRIPLTTDM